MPYFIYSTVNAGKTLEMLKTAYMYKERGRHVILAKHALDIRHPGNVIGTRVGLKQKADIVVDQSDLISELIEGHIEDILEQTGKRIIPCLLLLDEAQFLTKKQVMDLEHIVDDLGIQVFCYGLRTTYTGEPFEGSAYLMNIAREIKEITNICFCGQKATVNARVENGKIIYLGEAIKIDTAEDRSRGNFYTPLCRKHWKKGIFAHEEAS